jgi:hypothetical protein
MGAKKLEPFARHAYMAYLPTVEFGPGMTSATEIRAAWPRLNDQRKTALVMSLYPKTQKNPPLAANVVKLLDTAIGGDQGVAEGSLNEGLAHPVIVVDVQPEYSGMNDGDESAVFPQIINFVNKQTGPVLMFVNAEDQGLSGDTVAAIQTYWEDTIDPDWYDNDPDTNPINWSRFQIVDKGYGYFRGWMDAGIEPSTIIATIRELYQQHKNDSRELQFPPFNKRTTQQSLIQGAMEELNDEPLSVNWTSVAQLKRFNGAYLVGGARDQCLREVELLMNAFNIKYKRIDSLIYEGQQGVAEAAKKCPPATQDITMNLNNRQKAIDEYGYGPLNPDMPNRKFWMKKVDEWNLDSVEEAQSSLCGNCAAFDIRQDTLDCIAQGIDADSPEDAQGVIDAGDLGYCKFLKFKCASRRTCDAWVTGGPLMDKPDVTEVDAQNFVGGMTAGYQRRENQPVDEDYIDEKWSQKYKSSINCASPRGFSQRAHCQGRKK